MMAFAKENVERDDNGLPMFNIDESLTLKEGQDAMGLPKLKPVLEKC